MARNTLTLAPTTKPFRSSRLALPPSPFSPQFALTTLTPAPLRLPVHQPTSTATLTLTTPPPPPPPPNNPLNWLWQCHQCSRIYALGTTRRCLDDGHYFCAGTPVWKRDRKTGRRTCKKSKACASEFDYAGWKAWGNWRRELEGEEADRREQGQKNCGRNCDYPSECKWGRQYGVAQTTAQENSAAAVPVTIATTFDGILASPAIPEVEMPEAPPPAPLAQEVNTSKPSLDDLLTSVKRRKRLSTGAPPSPLTTELPAEGEKEKSARALQKAFDDFELDMRKSLGRAGEFVASALSGLKTRKASNGVGESDGNTETKSLGD